MWNLPEPAKVKCIVGILAADENALQTACRMISQRLGEIDLRSPIWPFEHTDYYNDQTGNSIIKQILSLAEPIDPGRLAEIKHTTNEIEKELADQPGYNCPRPVNLDPGYIEPSKLILASTKNFANRIYIGRQMYAEVTLIYRKGRWQGHIFTYPDHSDERYHSFLDKVRQKLMEQTKSVP
jgi:hypothetical protein